jgi:hypothetical protein
MENTEKVSHTECLDLSGDSSSIDLDSSGRVKSEIESIKTMLTNIDSQDKAEQIQLYLLSLYDLLAFYEG